MASRSFAGRQGLMPRGWNKTRDRFLAASPICVGWPKGPCGEPATIADHIVPRFEGGADDGPLQPLCAYHSGLKTAAEGHRARAAKSAALRARFDTSDVHPSEL